MRYAQSSIISPHSMHVPVPRKRGNDLLDPPSKTNPFSFLRVANERIIMMFFLLSVPRKRRNVLLDPPSRTIFLTFFCVANERTNMIFFLLSNCTAGWFRQLLQERVGCGQRSSEAVGQDVLHFLRVLPVLLICASRFSVNGTVLPTAPASACSNNDRHVLPIALFFGICNNSRRSLVVSPAPFCRATCSMPV